jgi:cytochrome c-type biogenesis protein CcmH/NrfF
MRNKLKTMTCLLSLLVLLGPVALWAQSDAVDEPAAGELSTQATGESQVTRSDEEISQMALALFTRLMSPYCPGASLRDCGSGQAEVLRGRVRDWLREGRDEAWIENQLVAEFGENILGAPRFKGVGIIAYVAPILALLIGLAIVLRFVESQKSAAPPADEDAGLRPPNSYTPSDEMRRRVREELDLDRRQG